MGGGRCLVLIIIIFGWLVWFVLNFSYQKVLKLKSSKRIAFTNSNLFSQEDASGLLQRLIWEICFCSSVFLESAISPALTKHENPCGMGEDYG